MADGDDSNQEKGGGGPRLGNFSVSCMWWNRDEVGGASTIESYLEHTPMGEHGSEWRSPIKPEGLTENCMN